MEQETGSLLSNKSGKNAKDERDEETKQNEKKLGNDKKNRKDDYFVEKETKIVKKSEIIKLNVGGTKFVTSASTLTRISGSFFSQLLEGSLPSTLDDEGYYFIDRDGQYFGIILNYLRTDEVFVPSSTPIGALMMEADFYLLPDLWIKLQQGVDDLCCGGRLFFQVGLFFQTMKEIISNEEE